ncbi:flagellar hook-length control protein FliK [Paenibacillus cisolokensis]|uniref:flagellar hook-length control protein FliK n=1 Tax=Paenibacillus cisolokensis TaxID=1658519 RepID=UPI003D28F0F3
MTLIQGAVPSISSASTVGSTSKAGTAGGTAFEAVLVSQLSGQGASESETAAAVALPVLPAESDEAVDGLVELLTQLLDDLDLLDEALAEDPSLLQQLQAWLAQANLLIQGDKKTAAGKTAEAGDGEALLPPLAMHSDTVRFAVQDTVAQLIEKVKLLGSQAQHLEAPMKQLVQAFQGLMGEIRHTDQTSTAFGRMLNDQTGQAASTNTAHAKVSEQAGMSNGNSGTATGSNPNPAPTIRVEGEALKFESLFPEGESLLEQGTVTAGQLALRSGTQVAIKPAAPPVPVENFANEMTNFIINKLEIVKMHGATEARISLNPEHLGQVDIKLTMQNGQLIAQFMTRTAEARELIDQQMAQLRAALAAQGLQVEKIEVTQSSSSSTAYLYQDGRQSGSGQQQSQQHRPQEKDRPNDDAVIAADLTEEWNDWLASVQAEEEEHGGTFTAEA